MGRLVVRILGGVGAATLSVTILGSGVASADAVTGHTYSDASAAISSVNGTPVIATVSGDQLVTDDCIVTSWRKSIFLDSSGRNGRSAEWLLNLNCNNPVASPGKPGNSLMTPEGVQAKKNQQNADKINNDPTWCQENDTNLATCRKFCDSTGLCEV
ncbi:MAG: hypothetical protein JWR34_4794 [Mycobacterium sp.]|nr:hypothetical protein [Mycobacterium sp.]